MKIEIFETIKEIPYRCIDEGDWFLFNDKVYIKIELTSINAGSINAINVEGGSPFAIGPEQKVIPLDVEIKAWKK